MNLKHVWLSALLLCSCVPLSVGADPLKLKLSTAVEGRYTDNVFFDADDPSEDFVTRVSPGLQIGWHTEACDISLGARADAYYYRDNDGLNTVGQSYNVDLTRRWSPRMTTAFSAAYLDDEQRDRELAETGLLFSDDRRRRQSYGISGSYQLSELSALQLAVNAQAEDFDDALTNDLTTYTLQVLYTRRLAPFWERTTGRVQFVAGRYDYARDYDTTVLALGLFPVGAAVDEEQNIDYYSMRLGLAHDWSERFRVTADVGSRLTRNTQISDVAYDALLDDVSSTETSESYGFVAMLEGVYSSEKGQVSLMASHDLVPASGREGTTERTTLRLSGSRRLSYEWFLDGAASGYLNRSDESGEAADSDLMTLTVNAGLRYQVNRMWRFGLNGRSTWIDDRVDDEDKRRNDITLRVTWIWDVME